MKKNRKSKASFSGCGFTLVELLVIMVILSIAALTAIPMFSSGADIQVRSAANKIAADLDYAKGLAITTQKKFTVVFDTTTESYRIQDSAGTIIEHPLLPGDFQVNLQNESRLSRVDIYDAYFDGDLDKAVTFDYLGAPYSGLDDSAPLNVGRITLKSDTFTLYVDIEPVTGYVKISGS